MMGGLWGCGLIPGWANTQLWILFFFLSGMQRIKALAENTKYV
jgi:hypothetical protein